MVGRAPDGVEREMTPCLQCGALCADEESLSLHLLTEHTEAVVDQLTSKALKEAYEIFQLEKLWKMRVH